jgi:hypothetical protein
VGRSMAYGSETEYARSIDDIAMHPMLDPLKEVRIRGGG